MQISLRAMLLKSRANLVVVGMIGLASCSSPPEQPPITKIDKPFMAGGSIEMQLDGGDYTIRAGSAERIRVSFGGDPGNAGAELGTNGTRASLAVRNTPHSNFRATIEVPATADLAIRLSGGNLEIASIKGNKDIESKAGNVEVSTPNSDEYGRVDASVTVGNLDAGPFGNSGSGISPSLKWSGSGKYTLRAVLGAGNLELKR